MKLRFLVMGLMPGNGWRRLTNEFYWVLNRKCG